MRTRSGNTVSRVRRSANLQQARAVNNAATMNVNNNAVATLRNCLTDSICGKREARSHSLFDLNIDEMKTKQRRYSSYKRLGTFVCYALCLQHFLYRYEGLES